MRAIIFSLTVFVSGVFAGEQVELDQHSLLARIAELEAENKALKQEIEELKGASRNEPQSSIATAEQIARVRAEITRLDAEISDLDEIVNPKTDAFADQPSLSMSSADLEKLQASAARDLVPLRERRNFLATRLKEELAKRKAAGLVD